MKLLIFVCLFFVGCFFLGDCLGQGVDTSGLSEMSYAEIDSVVGILYEKEEYEALLPYAKRALTINQQQTSSDSNYIESLQNLGVIYLSLHQFDSSEFYLNSAKNQSTKINAQYIRILNNFAGLYKNSNKYKQSIKLYSEAKKLLEIHCRNEPSLRILILKNHADLHKKMGQYKEAESLFLEAMKISKSFYGKDHLQHASILDNLGGIYELLTRYKETELLFLEAMKIRKKKVGIKHPTYLRGLNNLAALYMEMQQYKKAELLFLEVKENSFHYKALYANTINNLGGIYIYTKKYEKGLRLLEESIKIEYNLFGNSNFNYLQTANNLAVTYLKIGQYRKSINLLKKTLTQKLIILDKRHPSIINTINNLAVSYLHNRQLDSAFFYSVQSLSFNNSLNIIKFPTSFTTWSKHYLDTIETIIPMNYREFSTSLLIFLIINKKQLEIGKKTLSKYQLSSLYRITKTAIKTLQFHTSHFIHDNDKLRLIRENHFFNKYAIKFALESKDSLYLHELYSFIEMNKSSLLTYTLQCNKITTLGEIPNSLRQKEKELKKEKVQLKANYYKATTYNDSIQTLYKQNQINIKIQHFLTLLKKKYPQYYNLRYKNITVTVAEIQTLIPKKTLLLEYYMADSVIYLFTLTKQDIKIHKLKITKQQLTQKTTLLRQALSDYEFIRNHPKTAREQYTKTAHWFYQNLVAPALDSLDNIKQLIIVPDHSLNHIPFEVFLSQATDTLAKDYKSLHYLVKDYNISYNYSATLLKENINNISKQNNNKLLACAGHYTHQDSSLMTLRKPHLINQRNKFNQLKSAEQEVAYLQAGFEGDFLTAKNANERSFKAIAQNYGVIHLAMHARSDTLQPILSSLIFTEDRDSIEDNFLQAYEISRLNLQAQLVVLSACETGYGVFEQGEGVLSLARSFMYAGVPSLVVSLWSVDDASTALLMKSFYNYLAEGLPKDEALRLAKLDFFEQEDERLFHPFFWASFIQLGTTQPVLLARKQTSSWSYLLAPLLLIIGYFIWRKKRITRKNEKI